jgi:hypothetical protein
MGRGKKYQPEQVVNLLRQIEVAVANGKTTALACKAGKLMANDPLDDYEPSSLLDDPRPFCAEGSALALEFLLRSAEAVE